MPRKLSDGQVADLRARAGAGEDLDALAVEFGVSRRHVNRLVRGDQRQQLGQGDGDAVTAAVRGLLDGLDLADDELVLAASAVVLARKLDAIASSESAASAAAAPGLVRQLGDTMREIRGQESDFAEQMRRMLEPLVGVR